MHKTLLMLSGIPGSGKSYWANCYIKGRENYVCIVSRDKIRFSLLKEDDDYFAKEKQVVRIFAEQIQKALDDDKHQIVIADATHNTYKSRISLLKRLVLKNVDVIPVCFNTSLEKCLENNNKRVGRENVSEKAIKFAANIRSEPYNDGFDYKEYWYV